MTHIITATDHNTDMNSDRPSVTVQDPPSVGSTDRRDALTDPGYMWVEVGSHRGRDYLKRQILSGNLPYAYRPADIFKSGEYYRIHTRHAEAVARIKGLKIRKRLHVDDLMQCWGYELGEREVVAA